MYTTNLYETTPGTHVYFSNMPVKVELSKTGKTNITWSKQQKINIKKPKSKI